MSESAACPATRRSGPRLDAVTRAEALGRRALDRLGAGGGLWLAVAGVLLVGIAWAIASPVFAYPDEGAHVTRAAAVVDGQVIAPHELVSKEAWPVVRAPNSLAQSIYRAPCLWSGYGHPTFPASCPNRLPSY